MTGLKWYSTFAVCDRIHRGTTNATFALFISKYNYFNNLLLTKIVYHFLHFVLSFCTKQTNLYVYVGISIVICTFPLIIGLIRKSTLKYLLFHLMAFKASSHNIWQTCTALEMVYLLQYPKLHLLCLVLKSHW